MGYLVSGFIGFLIGTVLTCILLTTKNLEAYKQIENKFSGDVKSQFDNAKAMYNGMVAAYENGGYSEDDNAENSEEISSDE